jgi:glycosyltransferase involved in cell wall biosynthesis
VEHTVTTSATPEITVVIPTRNRWPLLRRALRTALWQDDVSLEVIVVDDGSTDETPEELAGLSDRRVRSVRHVQSKGLPAARNAAIREARSEWLAFLDDDDLWAPRKLRFQLDAAGDDVVLVAGGTVFVDAEGRVLHYRSPPRSMRDFSARLLSWNVVGSPSGVIARTQVVRDVGGFDEDLSMLEDWDLWLRLAPAGIFAGVPVPLVAYTLHSGNMHARSTSELLAQLERIRAKLRAETPPRVLDVNSVDLARMVAGGQRRAGQRRAAGRTYLESGIRSRNAPNLARGLALLTVGERPLAWGRRLREPQLEPLPWLEAALRMEGKEGLFAGAPAEAMHDA